MAHGIMIDTAPNPAELAASAEAIDLPAPVGEGYRSYLRAAVLVCLVAGAALGTLNLSWLVSWATSGVMPRWAWWPALLQAHGDAQLFGWTGLFIMGIGSHLLPRMLQRAAPSPWLSRTIFALVLSGLVQDQETSSLWMRRLGARASRPLRSGRDGRAPRAPDRGSSLIETLAV